MATVPSEAYLLHLIRGADRSRREGPKPMSAELRALEFWRAIIGECLASLVYVFLACGAPRSAGTLTRALCGGFAMATAAHAFGHISGAHANPALTLAMLVTRRITPLRALFYAAAQCGGAIAGAALLYGVTSPGSLGGRGGEALMGCTLVDPSLSPWQAAAFEMVLTFVVGLTLFASADPERKSTGSDALALGIAYIACSLIALPATGASMNPARSLGPAFVMNTWTHHWVYWCGPAMGGVMAGLIYEYIFESPRKVQLIKDDSNKDVPDIRDDTDSKSSSGLSVRPAQIHQAPPPRFRAGGTSEGPRPLSRNLQANKYGQQQQQQPAQQQPQATYYSTVPRGGLAYNRTWGSSEYGSSQQFKF